MTFANGYTMAPSLNLDSLGKIYIAIAVAWTGILFVGIAYLISRQHLPYLRIRNVPLAVSAVATLHVYWILCMIAYVLHGLFPCQTEYWIMSIYLPLGIALFQASNTQLLHIAHVQRKYACDWKEDCKEDCKEIDPEEPKGWQKYLGSLNAKNRVKRTMTFTAFGMVIQVTIATSVFLMSRKFHPTFGLTGTGLPLHLEEGSAVCSELEKLYGASTCDAAQKIACRRGWEWLPSIIWQFAWAWCYAPYLLWQVRGIQDTHGWQKQTVGCCLAGLFATPMWLCALYVRDMYSIDRYYVPPLWFAPSILLIEAFLIFVPCWQIVKNHRLQSETVQIIKEWESKNNGSSIGGETMQTTSQVSQKSSTASAASSRRGEMYTMAALESAIRANPQPLLLFAALKDFSGENISFLTKVLEWKRDWAPSSPTRSGFVRRPSVQEINNKALQRQQFTKAVAIYASYVSLRYSDFPINISHTHLKELEAVFERAALVLYGHGVDDSDSNCATPFDMPNFASRLYHSTSSPNLKSANSNRDIESAPGGNCQNHDGVSISSRKTQHTSSTNNSTDLMLQNTEYTASKRQTILQTYEMTNVAVGLLPDYVSIPIGFGPGTFDNAESSIKYMVLTNTWPKFVNAGYADSGMSEKSGLFKKVTLGLFGK